MCHNVLIKLTDVEPPLGVSQQGLSPAASIVPPRSARGWDSAAAAARSTTETCRSSMEPRLAIEPFPDDSVIEMVDYWYNIFCVANLSELTFCYFFYKLKKIFCNVLSVYKTSKGEEKILLKHANL